MSKVLESLLTGNPERFNRELPLEDQSELLPYDSRWEFPRDRLKLGNTVTMNNGRKLKNKLYTQVSF